MKEKEEGKPTNKQTIIKQNKREAQCETEKTRKKEKK